MRWWFILTIKSMTMNYIGTNGTSKCIYALYWGHRFYCLHLIHFSHEYQHLYIILLMSDVHFRHEQVLAVPLWPNASCAWYSIYVLRTKGTTNAWNRLSSLTTWGKCPLSLIKYLSEGTFLSFINFNMVKQKLSLFFHESGLCCWVASVFLYLNYCLLSLC